ncbi:hypothetical protein [Anaerohalosphaera lusitana]|uniref:hypothetical protein n=1 Tax=Anaerohalosphaera lusitana TaxID=1936003 RepID=UPI0011BA96E0|nr:hypothetical protein [Anaerohalosphaera lusitana]
MRSYSFLKGNSAPSPTPIIGLVAIVIGIIGLAVTSQITVRQAIWLGALGFVSHIFFQVVGPLVMTMIMNGVHHRPLFDSRPLPKSDKRQKQKNKN